MAARQAAQISRLLIEDVANVGRILSKLGARDRVRAVVMAYQSGLVEPGLT